MNAKVIAISMQKGGVGKTTTCANLGIGLAQEGKKILIVNSNPQGIDLGPILYQKVSLMQSH